MTLKIPDEVDRRLSNATRSLHTFIEPADRAYGIAGVQCRVCSMPIRGGIDAFRKRQYALEYAHEACGWFRPHEDREPTEWRRPGTSFSYWQWECPSCGLDACTIRKPLDGDPLECKRCRPSPRLEVGVQVELIQAVTAAVRVPDPRRKDPFRRVILPAYTRAHVSRLDEVLFLGDSATSLRAYLRFPNRKPVDYAHVRASLLSTI